jgi:hypothetical protein
MHVIPEQRLGGTVTGAFLALWRAGVDSAVSTS